MKSEQYLCSGWFFLDKFPLFKKPFLTDFFSYFSKGFVVLSLNLKRYSTCDHVLLSYGGLKIAILADWTINARYISRY